jgi:hypothetical protein
MPPPLEPVGRGGRVDPTGAEAVEEQEEEEMDEAAGAGAGALEVAASEALETFGAGALEPVGVLVEEIEPVGALGGVEAAGALVEAPVVKGSRKNLNDFLSVSVGMGRCCMRGIASPSSSSHCNRSATTFGTLITLE